MQLTNKLTEIANSIRLALGSSALMTIDEMPPNIDDTATTIKSTIEHTLQGRFYRTYITKIAQYGLYGQSGITELDLPNCLAIGNGGCAGCSAMTTAKLPSLTRFEYQAMRNTGLVLVDLYSPDREKFPSAANVNVLEGTPIASGNGYIIINDEYVDDMKTSGIWATYADQIIGNSDRATAMAALSQRQALLVNNRLDIDKDLDLERETLELDDQIKLGKE